MTHKWRIDGSQGHYVHHTSADSGRGTDGIGVGAGEDVLGPFSSARLAQAVANALNHAYALGWDDNEEAHGGQEFAPGDDPDRAAYEALVSWYQETFPGQELPGFDALAGDEDGWDDEDDGSNGLIPDGYDPSTADGPDPEGFTRPSYGD